MVKRQRDNTPPTSDDEEPQPKLVNYSDTESSDDEDDIRPPPRKRRARTMYSDDEDDEDLTSYYTIKAVNEKKSRLFRAQGKEFQLNIKTFPNNVLPYQFISRLFDQLVEDIKERCQMESNDKMRMTILHPGLKLGVFVTWRDVSAMTGEAVLEEIMKVLQSNENFRINDGQMTIQVSNGAKIRNRYNQVPHLTHDTNGKVTNSQKTPQTRAKRSALSQQVTTKHI